MQSKMQGHVAGSRAPLGLLLVCLHLPGMEAVPIFGQERTGGPRGTGTEGRGKGGSVYSWVPEGGKSWHRQSGGT